MKFPKINEYDIALLVVIAWIMIWIYPSLNTPANLDLGALLIIPIFVSVPIVWVLINSKINAFLKVFFLFTSWFGIMAATMVISTMLGTTLTAQGRPGGFMVVLPSSIVQPLLAATVLILLLVALKKTRLRWFNSVLLIGAWSGIMSENFNVSWTAFDPSKFFFWGFLPFILPLILYIYLVELRRSEKKVIAYMGNHIKGHWKIRVFRFGHFGGYIALFVLGMFLTLNLSFLKLFSPSAYLLMSVELTSPVACLLLALVTIAILILVPVAAMFTGKKIKQLITRR